MAENKPACVYCQVDGDTVPLVALTYQGQTYHICPQHLPVLIHDPQALTGKLPGVERLHGHAH